MDAAKERAKQISFSARAVISILTHSGGLPHPLQRASSPILRASSCPQTRPSPTPDTFLTHSASLLTPSVRVGSRSERFLRSFRRPLADDCRSAGLALE